MLDVQHLNVFYNDAQVLHDISFKINRGDWLSIIGLNGAGKSTLVQAIMGLVLPTQGKIFFKEKNLCSQPSYKRYQLGVGCVLEGRQLFSSLTVAEHFSLVGSGKKRYIGYDLFPILYEKRNHEVKNLSGGQQQMVAIATALTGEPELLILDEPSLGLAPKVVDMIWTCLQHIHSEGTAVLLIEQNATMALRLCNRAVVMTEGVFSFEGTPDILINNPDQLSYFLSFEEKDI